MKECIEDYLSSISSKFSHEETSEYGYRADFENLLNKLFESIKNLRIDHDPKAVEGNKPDFAVISGEAPLLYLEAKDIGISLDKIEKSDQMDRYFGYSNLVLTDYLEFRFYRNGVRYCEPIKIGEYDIKERLITPKSENYELLSKTLLDFPKTFREPIRSGKHLAKIMGGKARRIRDNIQQFYSIEHDKNTDLIRLYETLKKLLVHDLTINSFSDMYAQTLVYGLFVARYYDDSLDNFTRQEARELIPNSNPLLRHFFDHIVGAEFDSRLKYIVDELCEVFSHANVQVLMKEYFQDKLWEKNRREAGPVIHFYEDFLEEYDPKLKKEMGAYYTPQPVVDFIVNSVDNILKTDFKLPGGIADTSKNEKDLHKVQILDPSTGTGTFLGTIIGNIYEQFLKKKQKAIWPAYVHSNLLPRIFGFELMMAPYTIAHLRLGIAFRKTGFWNFHRRLGIYLTNSLEESTQQTNLFEGIGLTESIAEESKEASDIKNNNPIMVVVGNPPYFGESSNKNYHEHDIYKFEPTGEKLKEKNSKWINDDYVKFIRFAEKLIEKKGAGIVAMITAHGYIDNPTFRGMRWHLMKTFDEIYVLDLHGNSNKKEKSPDGSKDENVFKIKQGVAIFIGIKRSENKETLAKIYHSDVFGKRNTKYTFLSNNAITTTRWKLINPSKPNYEWIEADQKLLEEYAKGFSINDLFGLKNTGIVTKRDNLCIQNSRDEMWQTVQDFLNLPEDQVRFKYKLPEDVRDWKFNWAKDDLLKSGPDPNNIIKINYRPFDTRYMYYTGHARGFVGWPVEKITKHFFNKANIGLVTGRTDKNQFYSSVFVTKYMSETKLGESSTQSYIFPLYIYTDSIDRTVNLDSDIVNGIEHVVGKTTAENILNYVYAVLYSPSYRDKYKTFLKQNFPRIPYPKDIKSFERLVKFGEELIGLHLMESSKLDKLLTSFEVEGNNIVEKTIYKDGKVYINNTQYFGSVPEIAWNFYIGGYQPAQRWLKDRKGKELTSDDIEHYQKMIIVLVETNKIMNEIDKIFPI